MGNLRLIAFSWSQINKIVSSNEGKAVLIISCSLPLIKILTIFDVDIIPKYYPITLVGSLLIIICGLLAKGLIPELINTYKSKYNYAECMLDRYNKNNLDVINEFSTLNHYRNKKIPREIKKFVESIIKFLPIELGMKILGSEIAIHDFAIAKYSIKDRNKTWLRTGITFTLILAIMFVYCPIIISSAEILIYKLNNG